MATDDQGYRGVPHQAAVLVSSALWRSVHLAAPPLSSHRLTPQGLADLAPTVPDNTNARLNEYFRFHQYATIRITEALRLLPETHALAEDDRTWLRTRLEALRKRLMKIVPLHGRDNPARDSAVQVALERVGAKLRSDVEAHAADPTRQQRTVRQFVEDTLGRLVMDLRGGDLDPRFLVRVSLRLPALRLPPDPAFLPSGTMSSPSCTSTYAQAPNRSASFLLLSRKLIPSPTQIDMRAWFRYCHGAPWESLYYDDIAEHLDDMRDDLERIRRRRRALEQHTLAKSRFVPIARRRSGVAF